MARARREGMSHLDQKATFDPGFDYLAGQSQAVTMPNVTTANQTATRQFIRLVTNTARRLRLDYDAFVAGTAAARRALGLHRPPRGHHLPQVLPEAALKRFFAVIDGAGDVQHQILLRLLFYTAIRVNELVRIRMEHLDLAACRIFIDKGKGSKDRVVLFPESFRLVLQTHLRANPANRYLFESRLKTKFTTRHIQRIVAAYAAAADLPVKMHPHLLRHQMLTFLT
jgi:integrase